MVMEDFTLGNNKYLYQKIMSSNEDVVRILPTTEDLSFFEKMHIKYATENDGYVTINKKQLFGRIVA